MNSEEVEHLRKMLLDIDFEIAKIEKNHHLETEQERKEAEERLNFLYERREGVRNSLKREMMYEYQSQTYKGRGLWK